MPTKKSTIKVGSVTLPFWKHAEGWRVAYKDDQGEWKYITRVDRGKALEEGRKKAREINNQTAGESLSSSEMALWRRVKKLGITHADLDEWGSDKKRLIITTSTAVTEFIETKKSNRGLSAKNVRTLSGSLNGLVKHCGDTPLGDLQVSDLEAWLATYKGVGARRIANLRAASITFFRWARKREYLPDKTTIAEKLERPILSRKVPSTYTPEEMKLMLKGCHEMERDYSPWLVLAGFAGLRLEELIADDDSRKPPLDWLDFHWDRDVIIVKPETAKTGHRRVIPILPVVRAWLHPRRKESGPVCPQYAPGRSIDRTSPTLTKRLGQLVGGWRINALRHSFISYRAAEVGLAQTAMEAGNSETEAKKSYNDAKGKDEALKWFALSPSEVFGSKTVHP